MGCIMGVGKKTWIFWLESFGYFANTIVSSLELDMLDVKSKGRKKELRWVEGFKVREFFKFLCSFTA